MMNSTSPARRLRDRCIVHADGCRSYIVEGLNLTCGSALVYLVDQGFTAEEAHAYVVMLEREAGFRPDLQNGPAGLPSPQ